MGNRTSENIPGDPGALIEQLNRYQNTPRRGTGGWTKDGCLLVSTRFAETAQAHRVCEPLGMREQLTFYPEPVGGITPAPARPGATGTVFAKDKGGDNSASCTGSTRPPAPPPAHRRQAQPERRHYAPAATAG